MNVVTAPPAGIALRTLGSEDRQKIGAWIDYLKNWETDSFVRDKSKQLPSEEGVYVLKTSNDFYLFFKLETEQIVLLDIATEETISKFHSHSGVGR